MLKFYVSFLLILVGVFYGHVIATDEASEQSIVDFEEFAKSYNYETLNFNRALKKFASSYLTQAPAHVIEAANQFSQEFEIQLSKLKQLQTKKQAVSVFNFFKIKQDKMRKNQVDEIENSFVDSLRSYFTKALKTDELAVRNISNVETSSKKLFNFSWFSKDIQSFLIYIREKSQEIKDPKEYTAFLDKHIAKKIIGDAIHGAKNSGEESSMSKGAIVASSETRNWLKNELTFPDDGVLGTLELIGLYILRFIGCAISFAILPALFATTVVLVIVYTSIYKLLLGTEPEDVPIAGYVMFYVFLVDAFCATPW